MFVDHWMLQIMPHNALIAEYSILPKYTTLIWTCPFRFSSFGPFCSKASHGQQWAYGPKTTLKLFVLVLAIAPNSAQNQSFGIFGPEPPPPNLYIVYSMIHFDFLGWKYFFINIVAQIYLLFICILQFSPKSVQNFNSCLSLVISGHWKFLRCQGS